MKSVIRTDSDIERLVSAIKHQDKPLEVEFRPYKSKRSLDQNALYWKWLTEIKNHVWQQLGQDFTEDDLHDYYREKFLPVEHKTMGKTEIKRLTSTTKLNVSEMSEYMSKIDQFCIEKLGLMLPTSNDLTNWNN